VREDEAPKPAARERAAKPKYDITCAECGAPSQVPFKPLEGRQVYCQPCYRLRKIASPEAGPARDLDAHGADTGIVE
jgi:CxxC-x17-CxxC domain-containing protein